MLNFAQARRNMVDCQLRTFDVTDRAILAAMDEVPRERFVAAGREDLAYLDLSTEEQLGATRRVTLAPMVLARMIQALEIEAGTPVLDVATGRGYAAAVLATLGADVTALDSEGDTLDETRARLEGLGLKATTRRGDITGGVARSGGYEAILVNGAVPSRPEGLLDLLSVGGRLACVQGDARSGRAVLHVRATDGFGYRALFDATAPVLAEFRTAPAFAF